MIGPRPKTLDEACDRIETLEGRLDLMVRSSVAAWQALGYGPSSSSTFTLAEAIKQAQLKK